MKIVRTPNLVMVLYEYETIYRQIFTDGRGRPEDSNPTWMGYSFGQWDGDTPHGSIASHRTLPPPRCRPYRSAGDVDTSCRARSDARWRTEYFCDRDADILEAMERSGLGTKGGTARKVLLPKRSWKYPQSNDYKEVKWSHPPGSNRRPADYESAALPTELGWPEVGGTSKFLRAPLWEDIIGFRRTADRLTAVFS